ncbi:hypothetical protein [Frigoribacterium salinisoli]
MPTVDLAEAKQQTLGWTSMLMGAVPTELVAESWQHDDGVLMSCSEDSYQWSSAAEVTLDAEQDLVPMLERMAATWSDDDGFRTSFEKTGRGNPRLVVSGPGHAAIIIDARDDRRRLAISSFSTCVTDLADYDGGNTY